MYALEDLAAEYGVEAIPGTGHGGGDRGARARGGGAAPARTARSASALRERGSEELYDRIELPLTAVLAAMEDAGIKIDTYRMGEITARLADRVEELESMAYELAGEEFMLGSTQQVARILFEKLELTPGRKGKTGYSTDTRVLQRIRQDHEIVPVIEEWRELSKLMNTYLVPLPTLLGEDGRLHTTFNQAVAATGRLSTTNPNLQAIPIRTDLGREIRSAFVAESGHRLVSADYSQVELRILAHVSGEPRLRDAFERGEDIHTATAAEVLGKDPATLTKDERNIAKMVNFGIIYGISSFGLSENLEIPREQAQQYIDTYLARFPMVQDFIQRTIEQAERDGYVTTLLGRRRPGAGDPRAEPADALARRAAGSQLGDAGHGGRHHQGRDGEHPPPPARRRPCVAARAPGARRAARRGARRRGVDREGARALGDVRRVSARPAARRRRRRRRQLARGEGLEKTSGRESGTSPRPCRSSSISSCASSSSARAARARCAAPRR